MLTPTMAYRRLNKLLWKGRLPKAKIIFVDDTVMPRNSGLTVDDEDDRDFEVPLMFLNVHGRKRGKTLVHEMLHIAEPLLPHGKTFEAIVLSYWKFAKIKIKGLERV